MPENSALVVSGDFDPKSTTAMIDKIFKSWNTPKDWKPLPSPQFKFHAKTSEIVMHHPKLRML